MLRVFAPSGRVPAVLSADTEAGAMALEEILPGTEAEDLPPASLPQLWGELLAALHAVRPPTHGPRDLRGRATRPSPGSARGCPNRPSARGSTSPRGSGRYSAVRRLLDTQASIVLLHGDLHLGNVLDGGPSRGLVAIDPKACLGDPCFDAVDYVVAGAGFEGVEARCHRMAATCGLDGDRLYAWSRVIASMVAVAHLTYDGPEPAIDELLALAR
jgi:streptomycin 6-kinase